MRHGGRWRRGTAWLVTLGLAACSAGADRQGDAPVEEARTPGVAADETPRTSEVVWLALGGQTFQLEVAADPRTRQRGLSGRRAVGRQQGMLFVMPRPGPMAMVMRDCLVPLDVAFLDAAGRVLAVHEMRVEPPRGPGESALAYERRLPSYESPAPAQLAIEVAGGRLAQVGVAAGDRLPLDVAALARGAR